MPQLEFSLPDGSSRSVSVDYIANAGYAGRKTEEVRHHIQELARLGVPGPKVVPTLYPLSASLAEQTGHIQAAHARTSGEAEWALIVGDDPLDETQWLITAACDHTDRALEVHGVAWSKQSAPDVLGELAWAWPDIRDHFDRMTLRAWVQHGTGDEMLVQNGLAGDLLRPEYWIERLSATGQLRPRMMILSGTIPMLSGVDPFGVRWHVELADAQGHVSRVDYRIEVLPPAWE